jgi:hypothetical protein
MLKVRPPPAPLAVIPNKWKGREPETVRFAALLAGKMAASPHSDGEKTSNLS